MNPDFVDLLRAFIAADVRFLIVGAYALALHGKPRATGDLDVWIDATPDNAARVMRALAAFGAPLGDVSVGDFSRPGVTYEIGVAPGRIDILTELTGLTLTTPGLVGCDIHLATSTSTSSATRRSFGTSVRPDARRTSATSKACKAMSRVTR
jgi:hypothetical protein